MHPYCVEEQIEKVKSRARWRSITELSYTAGSKRWPNFPHKGRADTQNTEAEQTPNQSEWSLPVTVASIG